MQYDHLIDIKGLCCSAPIILLTKKLKNFSAKEIILIISDKSSMLKDIPAYCAMTNHELIKQEHANNIYHFWLRKQ